MNRKGFVLLSVLWVVVVVSAIGVVTLASVRLGGRLTANRVYLTTASWARASCGEILKARYAASPRLWILDTVELGRGAWCTGKMADADRYLNINLATDGQLLQLLGSDSLVSALRDWIDNDTVDVNAIGEDVWYRDRGRRTPRNRPLVSIDELLLIRGFDSLLVGRLRDRVGVLGSNRSASGDFAAGDRAPTTVMAEISAGVRGTPLVVQGRVAYRTAGNRLATLWQELP